MKRISIITLTILAALIGGMVARHVSAQSYASISLGPIAPTVAQCPAGQPNTASLCPVGSGASYSMYVSYNGGAYAVLAGGSQTAGVTTFNGRAGAVTLTKADVTGTGLAVATTVTSTATSTVQ